MNSFNFVIKFAKCPARRPATRAEDRIRLLPDYVRSWVSNGQGKDAAGCLLLTQLGHGTKENGDSEEPPLLSRFYR